MKLYGHQVRGGLSKLFDITCTVAANHSVLDKNGLTKYTWFGEQFLMMLIISEADKR